MPETVPCPKCSGSGRVALPEHLREVLKYLQVHGPQNASRLHRRLPAYATRGRTAINNALTSLEEFGLVTRSQERFGDGFLWAATRPEETT